MQTQIFQRILVADPDSTLASLLEERGFEVTSVKSGTCALERGAERYFDVFLIHYKLSDLNGGIVVDNLTQYSWKKRPLIVLYSLEPNPQLKKHSEGKFRADLYFECESNVNELLEIINQKISGKEIKSKFLDTLVLIGESPPSRAGCDVVGQSASFLDGNINNEELTALSRELEIAHRELNEISINLDSAKEEIKKLKDIETEKNTSNLVLQRVKKDLDNEIKKSKSLECVNRELRERFEHLRERAKEDLKILKERDNNCSSKILEIKRDSEKLMQAKDQKIFLLKKEFEELKFELERRGEKLQLSKERIEYWKHRVGKVTKALKVAMNVLENEEGGQIL